MCAQLLTLNVGFSAQHPLLVCRSQTEIPWMNLLIENGSGLYVLPFTNPQTISPKCNFNTSMFSFLK